MIARDRTKLLQLAESALPLWGLAGAGVRLINVSENATFLVTAPDGAPDGAKKVLRVHRPDYHGREVIESELAWMDALRVDAVVDVPRIIAGKDGAFIQEFFLGDVRHYLVLFDFVAGDEPDESQNLDGLFAHLGFLAARLHLQVADWVLPPHFSRPHWDVAGIFGAKKYWGDWRDAPNLTGARREVLEDAEMEVCRRLNVYGKGASRFGLIHADMRLANLLVDGGRICVIDFDDCGFGWFMYDFAASISFIEDSRQIPQLKAAWLRGYQQIRALDDADIAVLDTLVMLRRMLLLAWVGSHGDADIVGGLVGDFARVSAELATIYLEGVYLEGV